jgi:hypothetical protein
MKKILILLFVFTTIVCNATTVDSVLTTTNNLVTQLDTSSSLKMVTTKTMEAVKYLAEGLKVSVTEVWDILVKQQKVKSWTYLLIFVSSLFVDYLFFKWIKYIMKVNDADIHIPIIFGTIGFIIVIIFASYTNIQNLYPMLTGFLNPEYGAMQDIINVAKTLK